MKKPKPQPPADPQPDPVKAAADTLAADRDRRLLAAMDALDATLLSPTSLDGVTMPPAKALVDVIR